MGHNVFQLKSPRFLNRTHYPEWESPFTLRMLTTYGACRVTRGRPRLPHKTLQALCLHSSAAHTSTAPHIKSAEAGEETRLSFITLNQASERWTGWTRWPQWNEGRMFSESTRKKQSRKATELKRFICKAWQSTLLRIRNEQSPEKKKSNKKMGKIPEMSIAEKKDGW